ncbi:hypothetical protein QBC37DRAFT_458496 [Rhypophila decipiens]|uniref:Uncharacterized protein n=1 Tax=Rhypophila decipiens TaxID=261697 RepID=A0AAN6YBL1_9PEZI|nr:hypothetical protein QBC37DRAFT_458496 [Rhypophila decipiens]
MASIRSSSPLAFESSPSSPEANEKSRLLPDLEEEILSMMGDGRTASPTTDRSETNQTNNCQNSHCTDLSCETRVFQVPIDGQTKSVLESWVITYHAREKRLAGWYQWLGICWWRRIEADGARILAVVPNSHFTQDELEGVYAASRAEYTAADGKQPETGYAIDLERRLRKLDWVVQDEIYDLINDRIQSSSNAFRRRDWKLVMLNPVPGGEITDAPAGAQQRPKGLLRRFSLFRNKLMKVPKAPVTEYRLILRGTETKVNDKGWAYHNRYSRPWRDVDEKEIGDIKSKLRRRDSQFTTNTCINF